jgi:hypothetical protein
MFTRVGRGNDPDAGLAFLADPVSVTLTTGTQKVLVTSSKGFGTDSGLGAFSGAQGLDIYICHETGGVLTKVGTGVFGLRAAADTRQVFTLSASVANLPSGTYNFGLCGQTSDAGNWNSNEFSYTTALVTQ